MPETSDFAEFYGASFDALCVQLHAHTGSWSEAQDVVQEAFCRALARWPRISQYQDPAAWVRKVAWNLATSRWRRVRSNLLFVHRQRVDHTPGPDPAGIDLKTALATLPPRQRQAVVLHYLSDVPIAEIATMMDVAEGTVKSWLHRARTTLDGRLKLVDAQAPPPAIARPGPQEAHRTVRRRRDRATVLGIVILVGLAVAAFVIPQQLVKEPVIIPTPTPGPTAPVTPSPSASAFVQPGAPSPSATATCVSYPIGWSLNDMKPAAVRVGFGDPASNNYSLSRTMCPGVRLRLSWAVYRYDGQGSLTLVQSGAVILDNDNKQRTFQVQVPAGCHVYYLTATDVPVPQTIPRTWLHTRGIGSPFWDDRIKERSVLHEPGVGVCPTPSATPTASP